jgi:putative chitinase
MYSGVAHHLNGGFNGLDQRTAWLARWKTELAWTVPAPIHSTVWLQQSLNRLGADPTLSTDGKFGPLTSAALKAFQHAQGLLADGSTSAATLAALDTALDAAAWKDRREVAYVLSPLGFL